VLGLSPSTPEAISASLACSVYTVQPLDRSHAHSLLHLCSKVVHVLLLFIPCMSSSRVTESCWSYLMSPPTTPDIHSTVPYSTTLTSPPTISDKSLPLLFTAARPAPPKAELNGALHSHKDLFLIASQPLTGSGIDQNSLEVFGGHSYSPRSSLGILWICFFH
jgi:hypothetical protein